MSLKKYSILKTLPLENLLVSCHTFSHTFYSKMCVFKVVQKEPNNYYKKFQSRYMSCSNPKHKNNKLYL